MDLFALASAVKCGQMTATHDTNGSVKIVLLQANYYCYFIYWVLLFHLCNVSEVNFILEI